MTDKFADYVVETEKDKAALAEAEAARDLAQETLQARDLEVAEVKVRLAHLEGKAEADLRAAKEVAAREKEEAVKAERERMEREHAEIVQIAREQAVEEFQKSATYITRMGDFAEEAYEKAIGDVVGLHPGLPGLNVDVLHIYYKGPCPTRYEKKTPVPYTPLLDSIGDDSEEEEDEEEGEEDEVEKTAAEGGEDEVERTAASGSGGAMPPPKPESTGRPATFEGGGSTSPRTAP